MNQTIKDIFIFLEKLGLVDVLLPFAMIFAITYGIFERVKVFGDGKRNVHILISFVMSFMVVSVLAYVNLITTISRYFVLAIIAVISFALVYGLLGGEFKFKNMFKGGNSGGGSGGSGSSGSSSSTASKGATGRKESLGRVKPGDPLWEEK